MHEDSRLEYVARFLRRLRENHGGVTKDDDDHSPVSVVVEPCLSLFSLANSSLAILSNSVCRSSFPEIVVNTGNSELHLCLRD